jgi:hypothetical protein
MRSVAVREFRVNSGRVWRLLKKSGRMVVASRGKPIALLTDLHNSTMDQELRIDAFARGAVALSKLREHAHKQGLAHLGQTEIEAEIKKSRKRR